MSIEPTPAKSPAPQAKSARARNLAIGIGISVVFLYFTFRTVDVDKMLAALRRVDIPVLIAACVAYALHFVLRAMRWRIVVNPIQPVSLRSTLRATVIGFMANNLLPFRLGEVARAWVLTNSDGIPLTTTITTVVLVRLLDMVAMATMLMVVLMVLPLPEAVRQGAYVAIPVYLGALTFLFALKFREREALALLETLLRPLPARLRELVLKLVRGFLPGLESLRSGWDLAKATFLTHVAWFLIFAYNALVIRAFAFDLPWYGGLVLILVIGFAITIPSSPGYLGVYHAATLIALGLFPAAAIGEDAAKAFAIVLHAGQYLTSTAWGVLYLLVSPVRLKDLAHVGDAVAPVPASDSPAEPA